MTTGPQAVIDRVTLVVSDLDRAEDDYITTLGCSIEQRADIDPTLTGVLCVRQARGRRSRHRLLSRRRSHCHRGQPLGQQREILQVRIRVQHRNAH